ncbi:MAG: HAD-IA family hydrolase [Betaproteobacteria bacterium]|nr:HAD-IA family hydrolase [Betaproteobacteria bacterium]
METPLPGRSVKSVLFDLDGTLADTAPDLARALNRLRVERDCEPVPLPITRPYTSSGARGLISIGFGILPGHPEFEPLKDRFLALYEAEVCVDTRLYDGMPELLAALEEGAIPWGIVTNKATRFTTPLLAWLGIDKRAACVVCGDTTPRAKPHPDPLLHAAALLDLPPAQCLYVGDDLRDIQSARAAGMPVLAAGFGYLGVGNGPATWGADGIIDAPMDTLKYLGATPSVRQSTRL